MINWPKQSECDAFYGNPRGRGGAVVSPSWSARSLVMLAPPFKMAMGKIAITRFPVHRRCKDAVAAWLETVWVTADIAETGVAAQELKQFVERIERLEEEKKAIADDIKDVFAEMKGRGFDTKVVRQVIRIRKQDHAERQEMEAVLELYLSALGMA
jgi:uncharacterized protein (UPF0335 family)